MNPLQVALSDPIGSAIAIGGVASMFYGTAAIGLLMANPITAPATALWVYSAGSTLRDFYNAVEKK